MIGNEYQKICEQNAQLSEKKCYALMEKLHQDIRVKVDANFYFRIGGYTDYQQDVGAMVRRYLNTPGKGVKVCDQISSVLSSRCVMVWAMAEVNKWSKNFDKRPHRMLWHYRGLVIPFPACQYWRLNDPFAPCTVAETPRAPNLANVGLGICTNSRNFFGGRGIWLLMPGNVKNSMFMYR